jgi:PPK2 family polyphosphate:nucleotide phosphotransferase
MLHKQVIRQFRVHPGKKAKLTHQDTAWTGAGEMRDLSKNQFKERTHAYLERSRQELEAAQTLLYADDRYAVLMVLQAMDTAGKDGTIKHVMSGVNPQGCQVFSFKKPSAEELDHTFLWRYARCLPERGRIGIFNRSYYEDVLVVRVHPELLGPLPESQRSGDRLWDTRYDDINSFEHHLVRNGTLVLKFFLHISKETQRKRLLQRIDNPDKNWKFSASDLIERGYWRQYVDAYEEALTHTSTKWAPWYVIPADHKGVAHAIVAEILTRSIHKLDLKYPTLSKTQRADIAKARRQLAKEA